MNHNTLGNLIKNARISKGLKQRDVAELIETSPTVINRIECGGTKKSL